MRKTQEELKKAQNTIVDLEEEKRRLHVKLADFQKEKQDEIDQLTQQQRGLVRRINYLLQEKEKVEHENKGRNEYTTKLEVRLGNTDCFVPFLLIIFFSSSATRVK